jgi:hypothetical protein
MTISSQLHGSTDSGPRLTAQDVWRAVSRASFAVLSHVTPAGASRSSGVVYAVVGDRMLVAVAKESWKARHIGTEGLVSVTVPIRRGGALSLVMPIPPATVSFPAVATVHTGEALNSIPGLAKLVPPARRTSCAIVDIRPTGHYVTYGLGVPLLRMRDPERSRARIPVG